MSIGPGTSLGAYEITALLGAGGMGEVYRAHDTELGRDVAIKVLPPAFTGDSDRLSRFEREARVLAALNHPHIGAIYGVERTADGRALVLELVEGETLADRISRGPLPVHDAIRVASQIAAALDAAHRKGIVHRDLKPANIKFAADGTVKVLDFGLAKIAEAPVFDDSQSPTVTASGTLQGIVLGTAGYMSPEQARGQAVDARTDLWAFGCVLYEMLTGRRAFSGQTVSDTMARILEREPDWTAIPRATPTTVRELVRRCLKKDPFERPADISMVREVLDRARVASRHPARFRTAALVGAAAVVALSVAVFAWFRSDRLAPTDATQWQQLTNFPDAAVQPALSADGRMLAFIRGESTFASPGEVYLKMLPDGDPTPLTRDGLPKMDPVFSPDGRRVAYSVVSEPNMTRPWHTWEVPVIRGEPRAWLDNASGLRWVDADQLLFSQVRGVRHMGIVTAKEDRSQLRDLYFPTDQLGMAHRSAQAPDGRWVLLVEMDASGAFTPCRLISTTEGSPGRLVGPAPARCTNAAWAPDGLWMSFTADAGDGFHVWRQRFPDGPPQQLTIGQTTQEEGLAVAADGNSVVTSVGQQQRGVWIRDAAGDRRISLEGYAYWPLFSADGKRLCFRVASGVASGQSPSELWMTDLPSGRFERLLPGRLVTQYDLSPDDRVVASVREADGKSRLWVARLDGREPPRQLGDFEAVNPRFSRTGEIFFVGPNLTGRSSSARTPTAETRGESTRCKCSRCLAPCPLTAPG